MLLAVAALFIIAQVAFYNKIGAIATVTEVPMSQNVSIGQAVEFVCAVNDSSSFLISWTTTPHVHPVNIITSLLVGGGERSILMFIANVLGLTIVSCVVTHLTTFTTFIYTTNLLVQEPPSAVGMLSSTVLDNCTLRLTWTAPYTLTPINYYTINITRHSDGALLRSDTTIATQYLYDVSIQGKNLTIMVAAVNNVGAGIASSVSRVFKGINLFLLNVIKNESIWKYDFHILEVPCIQAVTIEACYPESACVNASTTIVASNDGRRVEATFNNLLENRKYSISAYVLYGDGIERKSQLPALEISTFDVQNASIVMLTVNQMCIVVNYSIGHKTLFAFLRLRCPSTQQVQNTVIEGVEGCINIESLNSNQTCCLSATDIDAVDTVDTTPAVIITNILIMKHISSSGLQIATSIQYSSTLMILSSTIASFLSTISFTAITSISPSHSQLSTIVLYSSTLTITSRTITPYLPSHSPSGNILLFVPSSSAYTNAPIMMSSNAYLMGSNGVTNVSIYIGVAVAILTITVLLVTGICCWLLIRNRLKNSANYNVTSPPAMLYESIDYLTPNTCTNMRQVPAPPLPPRQLITNIEMKECQAYSVTGDDALQDQNTNPPDNIETDEHQTETNDFSQEESPISSPKDDIEIKKCQAYISSQKHSTETFLLPSGDNADMKECQVSNVSQEERTTNPLSASPSPLDTIEMRECQAYSASTNDIAVLAVPQSSDNIEMKECQAYTVSNSCVSQEESTLSASPRSSDAIEMKECQAYSAGTNVPPHDIIVLTVPHSSQSSDNIETKECQAYGVK